AEEARGQRHQHHKQAGRAHQYFTQISSLAASEVRAPTPAVPWMRAAVFGLALYAELPLPTMAASPKNAARLLTATGTVYLFQPGARAGTRLATGAGSAPLSSPAAAIQSSSPMPPSGPRHV